MTDNQSPSVVVPAFFTETSNAMMFENNNDTTTTSTSASSDSLHGFDFDQYFDVQSSRDAIKKHGFKRIALQLPDTLLWASSRLTQSLKKDSNHDLHIFVLGDTSYGSCCVDEVTASHLKADLVIHYGHSCLSPATRLPVQYIFGMERINTSKFIESYNAKFTVQDKVVIFYQLTYHHAMESLSNQLKQSHPNTIVTEIDNFNNIFNSNQFTLPSSTISCETNNNNTSIGGCCGGNNDTCNQDKDNAQNSTCCNSSNQQKECCESNNNNNQNIDNKGDTIFGRKNLNNINLDEYTFIWIGRDCTTLTNLLMNFNKNNFYRCIVDEQSNDNIYKIEQVTLPRNQGLMKRYVIAEKCKDASIIGIVVATLTVQKYSETIDSLKKLILSCGKKPYVFVVGRLNVPKLANFSEIDIFVIVACPENTVIDSKEYYKPIATPFELNLALRNQDWTGEYITDFARLFPKLVVDNEPATEDNRHEDEVSDEEGNIYHYSLQSGTIKKYASKKSNSTDASQSQDIVSVDNSFKQLSTIPSASDVFLTRTYRGLESKIGETEVKLATQGRSGIPKSYDTDLANQINNDKNN